MTAAQLLHFRKSRGLTRQKLAEELGSISASAINGWESSAAPVPDWVEEKLLRTTLITLPIEDLSRLLEIAREESLPFDALLTQSIREYLAHRPSGPPQ